MSYTQQLSSRKYLWRLTWPLFIELFLYVLVGNVDQLMMSHYDENGVAAVGNGNQVINLLMLTLNVLCTASVIMISQYRGAGQEEKARKIYSLALTTNFILSMALSLFFLFGWEIVVTAMQVPEEIIPETKAYLQICGGSLWIIGLQVTFGAFLRAGQHMKESMVGAVAMNLINVLGNWLLIYGIGPFPSLGVSGAALSSVLSRVAALVIFLCFFRKHVGLSALSLKNLKPFPFGELKKLLGVGLPSAGENFVYSLSQAVILGFINTMGTYVITTRMYVSLFAQISFVFGSAVSQAMQVIAGRQFGARDQEGAQKTINTGLTLALIAGIGVSTLLCIFGKPLVDIFTDDPRVIELGAAVLFVEIFLETGRAINMTFVRGLQAAGDVTYPMVQGMVTCWAIATLFSWIFGIKLGWGLVGVWIAMAMDELTRGVLFIHRWKTGRWKGIDLVNK